MRRRGLVMGAAGIGLTGCGGKPTKVFDLSTAIAGRAGAPAGGGGPLVFVDKPQVAGYFDRTQMVTRGSDGRVSIHEFEVWSDPPAELIQRAVVDDLAVRFGVDRVMATPVQRYATPDWRVSIDVLRFDVDEAGRSTLDARWTLLAGADERLAATRRERIETSAGDSLDPKRRVVALRQAVSVLANRIADAMAVPR